MCNDETKKGREEGRKVFRVREGPNLLVRIYFMGGEAGGGTGVPALLETALAFAVARSCVI
jgi:hypothetical protein